MSLIQNKIFILQPLDMYALFTDNGGLGRIVLSAPAIGKVNNILGVTCKIIKGADPDNYLQVDGGVVNFYMGESGGTNPENNQNWDFKSSIVGEGTTKKQTATKLSPRCFPSTQGDYYMLPPSPFIPNNTQNTFEVNICFEVRDSVS